MTRKNHRYVQVEVPHPEPEIRAAGIPAIVTICKWCGTTKEIIGHVGLYHEIKSYVRPDGIRFTGCAPECIR
jgi:hypothetical protein